MSMDYILYKNTIGENSLTYVQQSAGTTLRRRGMTELREGTREHPVSLHSSFLTSLTTYHDARSLIFSRTTYCITDTIGGHTLTCGLVRRQQDNSLLEKNTTTDPGIEPKTP